MNRRKKEKKRDISVSNRCFVFDDTDGSIGITEYGEQRRVSGEDVLAQWACAGSLV